jgi:hypothetical protein
MALSSHSQHEMQARLAEAEADAGRSSNDREAAVAAQQQQLEQARKDMAAANMAAERVAADLAAERTARNGAEVGLRYVQGSAFTSTWGNHYQYLPILPCTGIRSYPLMLHLQSMPLDYAIKYTGMYGMGYNPIADP